MSIKCQFLFTILTICITIEHVNSGNILCLMGMASKSHHIWNKSIMQALANRNHNLTILTVEDTEISTKNMIYIKIEKFYEHMYAHFMEQMKNGDSNFQLKRRTPFETIKEVYSYYSIIDSIIIKSNGIRQLYNYPKDFKFDLVIHDFTSSQILLGFIPHFGYPPLVSVTPYNIPPYANAVAGIVNFPSYMPYLGVDFSNQMTFSERCKNFVYWTCDYLYREFIFMPTENLKAKEIFGTNLPNLQSIEQNSELVLVNIDWSIDYAQLLPPNVIPVGGLQVKRVQELEGELAEYMNSSKMGVILFSLGTNVQSSMLGSAIPIFLQAFRELNEYNFIWKFEIDDYLKDIPDNLIIRKFLPQNSILAHPNIKLFMTHGGLLSMQESLWYGVPMLGFPFFADQYQNMFKIKENGLGLELNVNNLTVPLLVENIRKIIENPSFKNTATKKSKLFRNQPMHPLDRAIYWIEHVLENNGAKHLKLGNSHLNTIQLYMLDIFGIAIIILIVFLVILLKYCCCRQKQKQQQKEMPVNESQTNLTNKKKN